MLKKILAILAMLYAAACFAAVDVNKATAAELDSVKGIGPAISAKIVDERKNGAYKDWDDLITRVKGVGDKSAAKLSEGGLTVNGSAYKGASASSAAAAKKESKAAAKEEKKDDKMAGMAMGKDEKKSAKTKKEEKAEAKAEAKEAKAEAKAAKTAKAETAKPAASAASVAKSSASAKK